MKIKTVRKVVKIGNSLAVTIPAKDARILGISVGKTVVSEISLVQEQAEVTVSNSFAEFDRMYREALEGIAKRRQ